MKRLAYFLLLLALATTGCDTSGTRRNRFNRAGETAPIREMLQPPADVVRSEGIAAAVLIDTSGSMKDPIAGDGGEQRPKILIAQEAVVAVLRQFEEFTARHPEIPLLVGVYEFSNRPEQPPSRKIVPLGPPREAAARELVKKMVPEGNTPIGDAMIAAKRDLDATGMRHLHLLVVSDGENNRGFTPGDVSAVIAALPAEHQAGIYFIAFDTEAEFFNAVKNAGGLILTAGNETDLRQTLDFILTGKILVERPVMTPSNPRPPHP